jgi:hypothetical protein
MEHCGNDVVQMPRILLVVFQQIHVAVDEGVASYPADVLGDVNDFVLRESLPCFLLFLAMRKA